MVTQLRSICDEYTLQIEPISTKSFLLNIYLYIKKLWQFQNLLHYFIIKYLFVFFYYFSLQKRNLLQKFAIPERNLLLYMTAVEEKYNDNPYHNRVHAADVVQSTHVLLNAQSLEVNHNVILSLLILVYLLRFV